MLIKQHGSCSLYLRLSPARPGMQTLPSWTQETGLAWRLSLWWSLCKAAQDSINPLPCFCMSRLLREHVCWAAAFWSLDLEGKLCCLSKDSLCAAPRMSAEAGRVVFHRATIGTECSSKVYPTSNVYGSLLLCIASDKSTR